MTDLQLPGIFEMSEEERLAIEKNKINTDLKNTQDTIDSLNEKIRELTLKKFELRTANEKIDRSIYDARKRREEAERIKREEASLIEQRDDFLKQLEALKILSEGLVAYEMAHEYQLEDVVTSIQAYHAGMKGMLNANDMGMGKTIETIITVNAVAKLLEEKLGRKPTCLWLTKKSLMKKSTPNEIKRWNPECKFVVPRDMASPTERAFMVELYMMQKADIFICNYEFIRTTPAAFEATWDIVVIDEVHKLKGGANPSGPTAIWKACKELCYRAEYILMLSGTPMVNAPEEMWSYLHIFHPDRFPTLKKFKRDFGEYKNLAGQVELTVDPNKILNNALRGQMIRRSAKEVGLQIPDLTYEIVELERTPLQDSAYKQMEKHFFVWLDEQEDKPLSAMAVIAQLTRLRQINVWPSDIKFTFEDVNGNEITEVLDIKESAKIDECLEIIENAQDQVVVFCTLNNPFEEIQRRCSELGLRCEIINGTIKNNFDPEYEFQHGKIDVLCLNSAMGEGLNLQKNPDYWPGGARYGIMLDRWWSPGRNDQCVARIRRQGGTLPVMMYELQTVPSVDQFIQQKNEDKTASFETIMSSDKIRPASEWKEYFKGLSS